MTNLLTHEFLSPTTWHDSAWYLAGWTMLHFFWVGALLGTVAAVLRLAMRAAPSNVRYAAMLSLLVATAIAPVGIAWWLVESASFTPQPDRHAVRELHVDAKLYEPHFQNTPFQNTPLASDEPAKSVKSAAPEVRHGRFATSAFGSHFDAIPAVHQSPSALAWLNHCVSIMPWIWIVGTPLVFVWLALGLTGAERIRRGATLIDDGHFNQTCKRLAQELRIRGRVALATCERIASPVLVGIVRPMILVPPAALTGLAPEEIEMVLLHELAHVRRWDNLVNLGQRVVEACLFFHPVVWLVSGWVRQEREACCDAFVVAHTAKPQAYAELLVNLAASRSPLVGVALARHPLAQRIRNILKLEDPPMFVSRSTLSMAIATLTAMLAIALWQPLAPIVAEEPVSAPIESSEEESDENDVFDPDDETLRSWFKVSKDNPMRTVRYDVQEKHPGGIEEFFDGLEKDLIGPQISFQRKWIVKGKIVEINAPAQAHKEFFPPFFEEYPGIELMLEGLFDLEEFLKSFFEFFVEVVNNKSAKKKEIERSTPPDQTSLNPRPSPPNRRSAVADSRPDSPFPMLEEQKMADRAWKMLGLELEKIGEDNIERVKKLGFEGGLKVSVNSRSGGYGSGYGEGGGNNIQVGDLLVGLHVWPTRTLTDVGTVLERPDLVELQPLKFYVVRQLAFHINVPRSRGRASQKIRTTSNESAKKEFKDAEREKTEGGYGGYGAGRGYGGMEGGYGGRRGGHGMGSESVETATKIKDVVVTGRIEVLGFEPTRVSDSLWKSSQPAPAQSPFYDPQVSTSPIRGPSTSTTTYEVMSNSGKPVQVGIIQQARAPVVKETEPNPKPTLLYDGKTFDQWSDQWRNELKTEKRIEALRALAAFGRESMGKKAANSILEVAGNYEYSNYTRELLDTPKRKLRDEILSVVAGSRYKKLSASIPTQVWLPLLLERLSEDPKKWEDLALLLLDRLDMSVRGRLELIEPLTEHERPRIKKVAEQLLKQLKSTEGEDEQ